MPDTETIVYTDQPGYVLPVLERELEDFTTEATRYLNGEWPSEAQFIGFRLKQGVYGQRQANAQMIRVKLPFGGVSADQMDAFGDYWGPQQRVDREWSFPDPSRFRLLARRGMLEFYADPTSAYFHPEFDPARRTILYCASGARAALAADTLTRLGYTRVTYLKGGLHAWVEAGHGVESTT